MPPPAELARRAAPPPDPDVRPTLAPHVHHLTVAEQLVAGARLSCPICWQGRMFHHPLRMAERCETCGWQFDRGNGYFVGAMYLSYWIAVGFGLLLLGGLWALGLSWPWVFGLTIPAMLAWGPLVAFPYSRMLWIWAEQRTLHHGEEEDARNRYEMMVRAGRSPLRVVPRDDDTP